MEESFQLNPNASPFIPGSLGSFAHKAAEKQGDEIKYYYSSGSVGFEHSDLLCSYDYTESSAGSIISTGSSSKGESSGSSFDPSHYEENDMDELALANMVFSMFPNVSTDFIDELLKANDFDINLTLDMLHELSSQDMLHDNADLPDDAEATNDLHDDQGVPGADNHKAEVSDSSSNKSQDLQTEKSATTSDVKSVLPKFSQINLLHNDLSLPDDEKSAGTSVAK